MAFASSDIEVVAKLARIRVAPDQIDDIAQSITDILAMVDQMQAVDTSAVEPMGNPHDALQRLRADEVTETNQREALMANAPAQEDGLFLVPQVIE
jgi:aspartyl-tRNA(Asn)/glutamyl-tRNA(Gln) amidotransferase subunit C